MTSYLKSWLWTGGASSESTNTAAAPVPTISTHDEDDGSDTETEDNPNVRVVEDEDDDVAPAFPSLNSAQRLQSSTTEVASASGAKGPRILSDSERMPPPPAPSLAVRVPGVQAPSSASSSLQLPGRGTGLVAGSSSLAVPPSTTKPPPKPTKKREKVALAPGHSALDWANLKSSGADLRVRPLLGPCALHADHLRRALTRYCASHRRC